MVLAVTDTCVSGKGINRKRGLRVGERIKAQSRDFGR